MVVCARELARLVAAGRGAMSPAAGKDLGRQAGGEGCGCGYGAQWSFLEACAARRHARHQAFGRFGRGRNGRAAGARNSRGAALPCAARQVVLSRDRVPAAPVSPVDDDVRTFTRLNSFALIGPFLETPNRNLPTAQTSKREASWAAWMCTARAVNKRPWVRPAGPPEPPCFIISHDYTCADLQNDVPHVSPRDPPASRKSVLSLRLHLCEE